MSVSPLQSVVPCQIHTEATRVQKVGKQCWRTVSVLILPSGKHCQGQVETVSTELRKKLGRYYTNQPKLPHHSWTAAWAVNGHAAMSFCIGMHTATLRIFALQLLLLAPSQEVSRSWSYSIRRWFNPKNSFSHVLNILESCWNLRFLPPLGNEVSIGTQ